MGIKAWFEGLRARVFPKKANVSSETPVDGDVASEAPESPVRSPDPTPPVAAPLGSVLGALFSRRRKEEQSRRRRSWGKVVVILALLGGVGGWIASRHGEVLPGPDLRRASLLEELLYAPLGVPLATMAYDDLNRLGVRQTVPVLPVAEQFRTSGDLAQISARGLDALFLSISGDLFPLTLRVTGKSLAVKWGLRPGSDGRDVLRCLGNPLWTSGDVWGYGDAWGSEVRFLFRDDRILAVEWRYPPGLHLP